MHVCVRVKDDMVVVGGGGIHTNREYSEFPQSFLV